MLCYQYIKQLLHNNNKTKKNKVSLFHVIIKVIINKLIFLVILHNTDVYNVYEDYKS